MINLLRLSINDFFTKKFILLSLLPFFISILLFSTLMIFGGNELFEILKAGAISGDYSFIDESEHGFLVAILSFQAVKFLIVGMFYILSGFFAVMLSIIFAAIIAGFLTPTVTKFVNQKYYKFTLKDDISTLKIIKISLVIFAKFLLILLICLPFLFVPVINLFVINIPFFYLFYKFMLIDIASNTLNSFEFDIMLRSDAGWDFKFACLVFYILALIPLVGIFFQLFFVMFLSHLLFKKSQIYRF
ncbi:hypothetical membrane protein (EI24 domain) [Campylobacter iguaniorum]|uniref:Hypothetical membrane protein (EI24 domain) n=1 Tax=Campylobacter iguaniorum TaxID=1244531 RepID=A0A076FCK3_9BACT|nr:EI24 domain-containing protein [Campylobacter iguaniorum]AII15132.1 hypothetical membrane protein (EI24 domain) [Campylobacter iguaniorum]